MTPADYEFIVNLTRLLLTASDKNTLNEIILYGISAELEIKFQKVDLFVISNPQEIQNKNILVSERLTILRDERFLKQIQKIKDIVQSRSEVIDLSILRGQILEFIDRQLYENPRMIEGALKESGIQNPEHISNIFDKQKGLQIHLNRALFPVIGEKKHLHSILYVEYLNDTPILNNDITQIMLLINFVSVAIAGQAFISAYQRAEHKYRRLTDFIEKNYDLLPIIVEITLGLGHDLKRSNSVIGFLECHSVHTNSQNEGRPQT